MIIDSVSQVQGNIGRCPKCKGFVDIDKADICKVCTFVICPTCGYCHCPPLSLVRRMRDVKIWAEGS